jgi:hypothetical protein
MLLNEAEMRAALKPLKLTNGSQPRWASGPGDTIRNQASRFLTVLDGF